MTTVRFGSAGFSFAGAAAVLYLTGSPPNVLWGTAIIAAVDHFCDFEQTLRAGFLDHKGSVLVLLLQRGLPAVIVVAAFITGYSTVLAYAWAAVMVFLIVLAGPIRRFDGNLDIWDIVRKSFGYWVGSIAQSAQQLDLPIVRLVSGPLGAGIYSGANRLVGPIGMVVNSAVMVFSPGLGQIKDPVLRRVKFIRFALAAAGFGLLLAVFAYPLSWLVVRLLGSAYEASQPIIVGVTIASGFGAVVQVLQSYLYIEGRAKVSGAANLASVAAGLAALAAAGIWLSVSWLWLGLLTNYFMLMVLLAIAVWRTPQQSGAND